MDQVLYAHDFKDDNTLKHEINILNTLSSHNNIIKCYGIIRLQHSSRWAICLDIVNGHDLYSLIQIHGAMSEKIARHIFLQVLEAVSYIHSQHVIHRGRERLVPALIP